MLIFVPVLVRDGHGGEGVTREDSSSLSSCLSAITHFMGQ